MVDLRGFAAFQGMDDSFAGIDDVDGDGVPDACRASTVPSC
jgi:hypothetical protein